jgi:penicillin-binding protein 2
MMRNPFRRKDYGIGPDRDDWTTPEEALVDSASRLSAMELPVGDGVFRAFVAVMLVLGLAVTAGVANLSIRRHDELAQLAWSNRTVNVSVPPPRGIIMDRNGVALVENAPSFDLLVVSRMVRRLPDGTLDGITRLAAGIGREPEELTLSINDRLRSDAVFLVATDISRDAVLSVKDALPQGFYLITSTKRDYTFGPLVSHVLGYVGKVSKADMARDAYYLPSDTVGRLGIEAAYEETLRGTHGTLVFGAEDDETQPPRAGANLALNLDVDAQKALHTALWNILRESGLSQAAAVAQDPRSGAVLAMASFPAYDDNLFSAPLSQENVDALFNSTTRPLFNRVIAGTYNPGSTIKPLIGMSALEEGIVSAGEVVTNDCRSISVPNPNDPQNPYVFENWRPDTGPFDLRRAIADSCNVYFYTVGGGYGNIRGLGVQRIVDYLTKSGANSLTGIDLTGEDTGFVPDPDWKWRTRKEPWYQGDTYNISIGQGDLSVTPLWINTAVSAIANGGTLWRPQVADRVVDRDKTTIYDLAPSALGTLPFGPATVRSMQQAMRATVTQGTGRLLQDVGVPVAAKTGTAEVIKGRRINSIVTAYAPADDPKIAVTILVEGSATNQGYALRAAREFLRSFFGTVPAPTPLPAAPASISAAPVLSP